MKTSKKIWFAVCLIVLTGIFVSSCTCVYIFKLHEVAYWWTVLVVGWAIEIALAIVLFNSKHMPDEAKAFWLIVLLFLPYYGALITSFLAFDRYHQKIGETTNQTLILQHVFKANQSIKIYTNSLFVPLDIIQALNFISFKGVEVQIIVSKQAKKVRNKLMIYNIDKLFETKVKVSLLNYAVKQNFIIVDDQKVFKTDKNFNFRVIFSTNKINESLDIKDQLSTFEKDLKKASKHEVKKYKLPIAKRFGFAIANIFYLFY